jgi:hypothetical protein
MNKSWQVWVDEITGVLARMACCSFRICSGRLRRSALAMRWQFWMVLP